MALSFISCRCIGFLVLFVLSILLRINLISLKFTQSEGYICGKCVFTSQRQEIGVKFTCNSGESDCTHPLGAREEFSICKYSVQHAALCTHLRYSNTAICNTVTVQHCKRKDNYELASWPGKFRIYLLAMNGSFCSELSAFDK